MEVGGGSSSSPEAPATGGEKQEEISGLKRGWVNFTVSLRENLQYCKATIYGMGKKITAKSEKEAAEADLQAGKMQVEATDAAENSKNNLVANK